ncbi:MAG TPA: M15 family metallopeptidase [Arthrobacter sp.]
MALSFIQTSAVPADPTASSAQAVEATAPLPVVNKSRPLDPASHVPPQLVGVAGTVLVPAAASALSAMIDAAALEGVPVVAVSGYRSFDTQTRLYAGYASRLGQAHTDALSARPGFSEHQTGLAVDIGNPDASCALHRCFAGTPAGSWAAANAARFGFIVRYPDGASAVTGYDYEPWHLRYVGPESAAAIVLSGLTLEAYEGLPPAPSY